MKLGGADIHYPTEEIEWAPLAITCGRRGTLAIRGNRMGYPCDWSKETLGTDSLFSSLEFSEDQRVGPDCPLESDLLIIV